MIDGKLVTLGICKRQIEKKNKAKIPNMQDNNTTASF